MRWAKCKLQIMDKKEQYTAALRIAVEHLKCNRTTQLHKLLVVYSVNSQLGTMGRPFFITCHKARYLINGYIGTQLSSDIAICQKMHIPRDSCACRKHAYYGGKHNYIIEIVNYLPEIGVPPCLDVFYYQLQFLPHWQSKYR